MKPIISNSDVPILDFIPSFTNLGLQVAFLVPTETGMNKSIMDATFHIRELLKDSNLHDYALQNQGKENKVFVNTHFFTADGFEETTTSLYRPNTKKGDPRLWIYELKHYCKPNNLLALIVHEGTLNVINLSDPKIQASFHSGYIRQFLMDCSHKSEDIAMELLHKMHKIHDQGYLESITRGDPGVGDTLEHALGIKRNPSKLPDYRGIELKATRISKNKRRKELFCRVPDWKNSRGMTREKLLDTYGYWADYPKSPTGRRFSLNCTLNAICPNSQGLYMEWDIETDTLIARHSGPVCPNEYVFQWDMEVLKSALLEKHPETFWIEASTKKVSDKEFFRYDRITHTKNPNVKMFPELIEQGVITLDLLMHRNNKTGRIRDHGFPFKLEDKYLNTLFPQPRVYNLELED